MRALLLAALVVTSALAPLPAQAQPEGGDMLPEARKHYDRGLEHYTKKEYLKSIRQLRRAYEIDPHRNVIYAWAQAERLDGNCERAVELYQEYIDSGVTEAQESAALVNMERCRAQIGPREVDRPAEESDGKGGSDSEGGDADSGVSLDERELGEDPDGEVRDGKSRRNHWYKDPYTLTFLGISIVGGGIAGASYWSALNVERRAREDGVGMDEYERLRKKSADRRTLAAVSGGVAIAAFAATVWRVYALDSGSSKGDSGETVDLWLSGEDGVGVAWGSTF